MKVSKYIEGTRTRESLIPATKLRADTKVREVAISCNDERLLAVTARDIVAAEAHYHCSCYRDYTRPEKLRKCQSLLTKEDSKKYDF